jgi:hypothetical protein
MSIPSDRDAFCQNATGPAPRLELDTPLRAKDGDLLNRAHAIVMEALGLSEDAAHVFINARALSEGKSIPQVATSTIYAWVYIDKLLRR